MKMKQAGISKAPIIFILIVIVVVVGIVILRGLGHRELGDNATGDQQAILLAEDFTGETLESLQGQGWSAWDKPFMLKEITGATVNFTQESISVTENGTLKAEGSGGFMYPANWSNYALTYRFMTGDESGNFWTGLAFRSDGTQSSGVRQGAVVTDNGSWPQNSYILQLGFQGSTNALWKIVGGTWTQITSADRSITRDTWYELKLEANGSSLKVYLDNQLLLSATDSSLTSGGIGLLNCSGPVYFDDVSINP